MKKKGKTKETDTKSRFGDVGVDFWDVGCVRISCATQPIFSQFWLKINQIIPCMNSMEIHRSQRSPWIPKEPWIYMAIHGYPWTCPYESSMQHVRKLRSDHLVPYTQVQEAQGKNIEKAMGLAWVWTLTMVYGIHPRCGRLERERCKEKGSPHG